MFRNSLLERNLRNAAGPVLEPALFLAQGGYGPLRTVTGFGIRSACPVVAAQV